MEMPVKEGASGWSMDAFFKCLKQEGKEAGIEDFSSL